MRRENRSRIPSGRASGPSGPDTSRREALRERYSLISGLDERPLDYEWYVPLPWFDKLFPDVRYFSPRTTNAAYIFYGLILEMKARWEVGTRLAEKTAHDHRAFRVKAVFAVERLGELVAALKQEGGVVPPLIGLKKVTHSLPLTLPPRVFPEMDQAEEA